MKWIFFSFACITAVSLAIILIAWYIIYKQSNQNFNNNFNGIFNRVSESYESNLNSSILLYNFASQYMKTFNIYNSTFQDFINLSALNPNITLSSILLMYNVTLSDRASFEQRISFLTHQNLSISDISISNNSYSLVPSKPRQWYCPIVFISPTFNPEIIGLDLCHVDIYNISTFLASVNSSDLVLYLRPGILTTNITTLNFVSKEPNGYIDIILNLNTTLNELKQFIDDSNVEFSFYINNNLVYSTCNGICQYSQYTYTNQLYLEYLKNDDIQLQAAFYNVNINYSALFYIIIIVIIFDIVIITVIILYYFKTKTFELADMMLGYVNHEIRNPLNCIQGLIEISIDNISELKQTEEELGVISSNLDTAKNACYMLNHIVNDILDFKKLLSKDLNIINSEINVHEMLSNIKKTITPKLSEKPDIVYSFESSVDKFISDETRIKQILLNFLSNSMKFTETGFVKGRIELIDGNKNIKISVKDSGIGIRREDFNKIFSPYQHTDIRSFLRHGGIGLGLYLCKLIIKLLDGKINFESVSGKGSTFWITIPYKI